MCPAHIAFSTLKRLKFTWTDTFEDVENAELEQLTIECRGALYSLEAELAARQNPQVDTKLEDCYARIQEKARTINTMGALSNKDRALLVEASTFLEALRSGHIDSSQTCETRKDGAIYEQLFVTKRTVEKLTSFQRAMLVKRMARYHDSLSSRALEVKANDLGLYRNLPLDLSYGWHQQGESCQKSESSPTSHANPKKRALDDIKSEDQNFPLGLSYDSHQQGDPGQENSHVKRMKSADPVQVLAKPEMQFQTGKQHTYQSELVAIVHTPSQLCINNLASSTLGVFDQLDRKASTLLKLLYFLDKNGTSKRTLLRARDNQTVWASSGEIAAVSLTQIGLHSDVISLVSEDANGVSAVVDRLVRSELIESNPGNFGRRLYLNSETRSALSKGIIDPHRWRHQAFLLVCHTFLLHQYLEQNFGSLRRLQISQVQHIAKEYHLLGDYLTSPVKHKIAEVLLAASNFLTISWKTEALEVFRTITAGEERDYLHMWAGARECAKAGLSNSDYPPPISCLQLEPRANAFQGQWLLAYTANQIRRGNLQHAESVLAKFIPLNAKSPSTMEDVVLKQKEVLQGQIFRYQGQFSLARLQLQGSLAHASDVASHSIRISQLGAVHCELRDPERAVKLLEQDIEAKEPLGLYKVSSGVRVRLALAEALIEANVLGRAEEMYLELHKDLAWNRHTNKIAQLRLSIGLARIFHLTGPYPEALKWWQSVVDHAEECGWEEGFIQMIAQYSMCHLKLLLKTEDFQSHFLEASRLFKRCNGVQFWWTGLGTSWWNWMMPDLKRLYWSSCHSDQIR